VLRDVLDVQADAVLLLLFADRVAHPQTAVVPDALDDPGLPVRHAHLGVVAVWIGAPWPMLNPSEPSTVRASSTTPSRTRFSG